MEIRVGKTSEFKTLYTSSAINSDIATYSNALSVSFSGRMLSSGSVLYLGSQSDLWTSTGDSDDNYRGAYSVIIETITISNVDHLFLTKYLLIYFYSFV